MGSEHLRRLTVQKIRIERIFIVIRISRNKRIALLCVPDSVDISLAGAVIARVKLKRYFAAVGHSDIVRQNAVHRALPLLGRKRRFGAHIAAIHIGVDAGIRARTAYDIVADSADTLGGILKGLLNRIRIFLHLPAVIIRAVIAQGKEQILQSLHSDQIRCPR